VFFAIVKLDNLGFFLAQLIERRKQREQLFLKNKFKKLLSLFNIYTSLYFANITHKYNTIINLNILTKKIKHI